MVFVFALGQFSYLRRTHEGVNAVPTPAASGGLLTTTQLGIIAWLPIAACFPYKAGCCLTVRRPGTFQGGAYRSADGALPLPIRAGRCAAGRGRVLWRCPAVRRPPQGCRRAVRRRCDDRRFRA